MQNYSPGKPKTNSTNFEKISTGVSARSELDSSQTLADSESSTTISLASNSIEITAEKYQRLATEYAKIRAQFLVLKKAVLEEQGKNNDLQTKIKANDQNVRRLEQEVESLLFRNKQLTKRCGVLQMDLDSKDHQHSSAGSGKRVRSFLTNSSATHSRSASIASSNSLNESSGGSNNNHQQPQHPISSPMDLVNELSMELKMKIEECEHLKQLTLDLEQQRLEKVEHLEHELKMLKENHHNDLQSKNDELQKLNSSLQVIKNEKHSLENKLEQMGKDFQETRIQVENLKFENKNLKQRLSNFEQMITSKQQQQQQMEQQQSSPKNITEKSSRIDAFNKKLPTTATSSTSMNDKKKVMKNQIKLLCNTNNKFYNDLPKRQDVIERFSGKLSELICALSTLHSNISSKISIMFALFNKNSNHFYFLDFTSTAINNNNGGNHVNDSSSASTTCSTMNSNPSSPNMVTSTTNNNNNNNQIIDSANSSTSSSERSSSFHNNDHHVVNNCDSGNVVIIDDGHSSSHPYRSLSVISIFRKFRDYLKTDYDTYLVNLEDASQQYSELKIRQQQQIFSMNSCSNDDDDSGMMTTFNMTDLNAIEREIAETSLIIVETFADYVSYLNKLNFYLTICLNMWCKQYRDYDPNNPIIQQLLDPVLQSNLIDYEKRVKICEKNELLIHSMTTCVRLLGQICNHVQLLLSKSLLKTNFLTIFNQFMHRVDAFERCLVETRHVFSSKVALEHDLNVTVEPELKSMDDAILSSLVFVSKCVQEIRLMLEQHYFFFVDQSRSNSPMTNGSLIDEDDPEDQDGDDDDDDDEVDGDDDCDGGEDESIEMLPQPQHEIVPENLETKKSLEQDPENVAKLKAQLQALQEKLSQTEKEKEYWSNETQNVREKLAEEQKRCKDIEHRCQMLLQQLQQQQKPDPLIGDVTPKLSRTKGSGSQSVSFASSSSKSLEQNYHFDDYPNHSINTDSCPMDPDRSSSQTTSSLIQTFSYSNPLLVDSNQDEDMSPLVNEEINNVVTVGNATETSLEYYRCKYYKVLQDIEMVDSRAQAYQNDCRTLRQRLAIEMERTKKFNEHNIRQESSLELLNEELRTKVDNYEEQLQAMSEHMATLNERLTSQRDEIDALKFNNINAASNNHHHHNAEQQQEKKSSSISMTKNLRKSFIKPRTKE